MLSMAVRYRKLQNVRTLIGTRSFATATISNSESNSSNDSSKKIKKVSLYSRISPLGNPNLAMTPELDDWIGNGKKVRQSELKQIIHDLRKRRRFHHALEVSEWMNKNHICAFTPVDYAVQLDLIGKVHGFLEAEKYFNSLAEKDQTDKTYGALLHSYVRQRETEKSLSHFEKMKKKGFGLSPVAFNDIMCLYIRTHQPDKVHDVLIDMKKNGVSPDNLSYRMCINSYGDNSDIEGMEKILTEMEKDPNITMDWNTYTSVANCYIKGNLLDKAKDALKKAENRLIEKDALGYNHLITIHARLGNKDDVLRLWARLKTTCKRQINREYIMMTTSLVRLGEFEEAEKLLAEWRSSGNVYDSRVPFIIVDGYVENGLFDKAKDLLDSCMETAVSLPLGKKDWKMDPKVVEKLLDGIGEKESVEKVESFVEKLKKFVKFDRKMYHGLLKGYINGGKEVGKVLNDMKKDGIEEDEETKKILGLKDMKV